MRYTTLPSSVDLMIDSRAKQSERIAFAKTLRDAAALVEQRELGGMERMSFTHVEFMVEDDE